MHLYAIVRGENSNVKQFITELQGKYLPFKWRKTKEEPLQDMMLRLAVRPIQLYEFAFPEEHKDIVMTTILGNKPLEALQGNDGEKPCHHAWKEKIVRWFSKLLGLDPIPEYKTDQHLPVLKDGVQVIGLGTKKDYMTPLGFEGI